MSREKTINFYDNESAQYSRKRYEGVTQTYFQFLFKKRQSLFLKMIGSISMELQNASALEMGCADGVLIKKLLEDYSDNFSFIIGVDVSPKMLDIARLNTKDQRISYYLRGAEPLKKYDLLIELGVHATNFEEEIVYMSQKLKSDGYFIHSVSGKNSLHVRIKLQKENYIKDYLNYDEYEEKLKKYFIIIESEPYGLFIPKLWTFPILARILQPVLETIFKKIFTDFFHEKIYLLKKKNIDA